MRTNAEAPIPLVIHGVPFHNLTFEEAVDWIVARVRSGRPASVATANLDFLTRAASDPELRRLLIEADLVLADGFPIVKLAPFYGPPLKERVTGSDITPMLAARAAREGLSVYGLGGAPGVAQKAMELLQARNPGLRVAGAFSPPFSPLFEMDHPDLLRRLEAARPDILFVAFGAPKQDKFIRMHVRGWRVPVAMGVGASLDFIAGEQRRAPVWMQRVHLEWLWRVGRSPRRLFKRYWNNVRFLCAATRRMARVHNLPDKPVVVEEPSAATLERLDMALERFQPLESEAAARAFAARLDRGHAAARAIVLDIHATPWLNSLELGALLEANKALRARGGRLLLYGPRPKVRRLLETCRLTDFFNIATRVDELEAFAASLAAHAEGAAASEGGALSLALPLELTAATLPGFEREAGRVHRELSGKGLLKSVEIDASRLEFIDSSGLGYLIGLKKAARDARVPMFIEHLAEQPRRVFEIARVDGILLRA